MKAVTYNEAITEASRQAIASGQDVCVWERGGKHYVIAGGEFFPGGNCKYIAEPSYESVLLAGLPV